MSGSSVPAAKPKHRSSKAKAESQDGPERMEQDIDNETKEETQRLEARLAALRDQCGLTPPRHPGTKKDGTTRPEGASTKTSTTMASRTSSRVLLDWKTQLKRSSLPTTKQSRARGPTSVRGRPYGR